MAKRGNIHPQFKQGAEFACAELLKAVRFQPDLHKALRQAIGQLNRDMNKADNALAHTPQSMRTLMPMNKRNGVADSHYL